MKLDDLNFEIPLESVDEENWDLEKWRRENPMDYFKALSIMSKAENSIVISEIFKVIYKVTRLHIPDVLYKYYSISNDNTLNVKKFQTLSDGKIFMSEIKDFNDPFDGKGFFYNPRQLADIERLKVHGGKIIDDFTTFIRGTCFTENGVQSMPMWAHYCNNHEGFCVSYNVKENLDLSSCIYPVQYTNERLDVTDLLRNQVELICNRIDENVKKGEKITVCDNLSIIYMALLLYNVKHFSWGYEKEFRCTTAANAIGMPFINAKPKEIYIGMKCAQSHVKALEDIADYWDIPIYQMVLDECSEKYELFAKEYEIK